MSDDKRYFLLQVGDTDYVWDSKGKKLFKRDEDIYEELTITLEMLGRFCPTVKQVGSTDTDPCS